MSATVAIEGLDLELEVVESVPKIERDHATSKYEQVFQAARDSKTGIVSFSLEDDAKAGARASYLRRLAAENDHKDIKVNQRDNAVFIVVVDPDEATDEDE